MGGILVARTDASRRPLAGWRRAAFAVALLLLTCCPLAAQAPPLSVEIVALDKTGKVPDSLAPADLSVTLGGQARPVLWVRRVSRGPGALADAAARRAAGQPGTVYMAEPNRTVVVAVDEASLPAGGERPAVQVASALVQRMGLDDRVALVRLPLPSSPTLSLTNERAAIRAAIGRIAGRLGPEERAQDGITPNYRHVGRDLGGGRHEEAGEPERPMTPARTDAADGEATSSADPLDGLVRTLTVLSKLPGRKTVAFLSTGLDERSASRIRAAARAAAEAHARLYVFDLRPSRDRRNADANANLLARLAQAAGGVLVEVGRSPEKDLEPLMPELQACFEIGLERQDGDDRAADRPLRVEAKRAGLIVRSPSFVGFHAPAAGDVEPPAPTPPAPTPPAELPRPSGYLGAGRVARPAPPAPAPARTASDPELETILGRLGDYAQGYIGQYSVVVAEESYQQSVPAESRQRRLRSDLLFVKSEPSQEWVSFRDVFEVDGKAVRDRDQRLEKLFLAPSPEGRGRLQAIKDESARYNIGPIVRNINVPLYPLKILLPANRGRFAFSLGRSTDVDGVKVRPIMFTEIARPALVQDTDGYDVPIQGRFLVEPATGAIVESTVSTDLEDSVASIVVRYALNGKLGLWVPSEMKERYSGRARAGARQAGEATVVQATAKYSNFRRFQVSTEEKLVITK